MENEKDFKDVNNFEEKSANNTAYCDENTGSEAEKEPEKKGFLKELYEWTQAIAVAVVLALFINQFVFSIVEVQGASMEPTLNQYERLFVFKPFYKPRNKDIVIVWSERLNKYIVKRVIATEGQVINIDESGNVYIDGEIQHEPYISAPYCDNDNFVVESDDNIAPYPYTVPEDHVFVMGDNRPYSNDSRGTVGVIKNSDVVGKAVFRIWPFNSISGLYGNLK